MYHSSKILTYFLLKPQSRGGHLHTLICKPHPHTTPTHHTHSTPISFSWLKIYSSASVNMVLMTKTQSPTLGLYCVRLSLLKTPSFTRKGGLVSSQAQLFLFLCHRPHGCLPFPLHLTSESRSSISRFSSLSHLHRFPHNSTNAASW